MTPVHDDRTALPEGLHLPAPTHTATGLHPDLFVGQTFLWSTGLTGTCKGHMQNVGMAGNFRERAMLAFVRTDGDSIFCVPWEKFAGQLRPWSERRVVGSGPDGKVYGPAPDGWDPADVPAQEIEPYTDDDPPARPRLRAYATPGTPEHAEYERLSAEILHCTDIDRAGRIAARLGELRRDTPPKPERESFWRQLARALARDTPAFRGDAP